MIARWTTGPGLAGFLISISAAGAASASSELIQIQKIIGGVHGDTSAQAIQLRLRAAGQGQLSGTKIRAYDSNGENPILIMDFDVDLTNDDLGATVMLASFNFRSTSEPPAEPDFLLAECIPWQYLSAGSLTFESESGAVWWRVSWGGTGYAGDTTGETLNDDDGDFGPPVPGALPTSGTESLDFVGPASASSTSNAVDYAVSGAHTVFTNNAGDSFVVKYRRCAGVWECFYDANCDGVFDGADIDAFFNALMDPEQWQIDHPDCTIRCLDTNGDGVFDGADIDGFFRLC